MAKKMFNKRAISLVLALVMCFSMLQVSVFATYTDQVMDGYYILGQQGNITGTTDADTNTAYGFAVSKTIAQTGENQFDITLKVVTSQEVVTNDAAIQLVIDTSSSMQYCSEDCGNKSCNRHSSRLAAVKGILTGSGGFLDSLTASNSGKIYVSVVTFGSGARTVCEWTDIKTAEGLAAVKSAINGLSAPDNATNMHAGLMLARNRWGMAAVANMDAKFTVVLSDGYANCVGGESSSTSSISLSGKSPSSANATDAGTDGAAEMAAAVRGSSQLYTVGYGVEASYLQGIFGSNVYAGNGADAVTSAFANIALSAVNGMNGAGAAVTDPMGEYIIMGDVSGLAGTGVTASGSTITWKLNPENAKKTVSGNVTTYTYEITYPITLDPGKDGFQENTYYPANGYTYLTAPTDNGAVYVPFNIPAVCGQLPVFTVSYAYTGTVPADAPAVPDSASYKKNSPVAVADAPSAEHYTFSGWTTEDADVSDGSFRMPGRNVTLVGSWIEDDKFSYTLSYDGNGGQISGGLTLVDDEENAQNVYDLIYNIGVNENMFSRENYRFVGWNTAADGTGETYVPGNAVTLDQDKNTATLYAQWVEYPKYDYTVTYNANFGATPATRADGENVTATYATTHQVKVDANPFARENYTFVGWNTMANGTGDAYAPEAVLNLTAADTAKILYAQWAEHPKYDYTVTYNAGYGLFPATKNDSENAIQVYDQTYTIAVDGNTFTRMNHDFIGWATEKGGEVVFLPGDVITFQLGGSEELFAVWAEHDKYSYTVIYNGNGGENPDGQKSYGDNENAINTYATTHTVSVDENTFLRAHYDFIGWNTAADGAGTGYTAEDVLSLTARNNTITLYAQWAEHPKYDYEVIYYPNGGQETDPVADSENAFDTYDTEKTITVDENTFINENHDFVGWATEPNGEVVYNPGETITFTEGGSEELYAQWKLKDREYTVEYLVQIDDNPYVPYEGETPAGGSLPHGTLVGKDIVDPPAEISDGTYTYTFVTLEEIVLGEGENVVKVYFRYETPAAPVEPAPEVPAESAPETPAEPEAPVEPAPEAEEEPIAPVEPEPAEPMTVDGDGLVELPDEDVPLAEVPHTGDPMLIYAGITLLSGAGLAYLGLGKKKEEEEA